VLDGNGVLTLAGQPDPTTSKDLINSQNGNIDSNFSSLSVAPDIAQAAIGSPDIQNQFGNTQAPGTESAAVPECGPSPLNPDEIKAIVEASATRHGVDATFAVAIASVESSFDQNRNSGAGARGPMQLMPTTAERFGVTDVCDPASNIEGGVRYLRSLLDEFENPLLVAAAYNAGEERIYEYGGIPPFAETVGYVAKVLNYQLGLPAIVAGRPGSFDPSAHDVPSQASNRDVGVIERRAPGTFVGGVMQF
jgi:soluble lytic murein transglycosylase-like protein